MHDAHVEASENVWTNVQQHLLHSTQLICVNTNKKNGFQLNVRLALGMGFNLGRWRGVDYIRFDARGSLIGEGQTR